MQLIGHFGLSTIFELPVSKSNMKMSFGRASGLISPSLASATAILSKSSVRDDRDENLTYNDALNFAMTDECSITHKSCMVFNSFFSFTSQKSTDPESNAATGILIQPRLRQ